MHMQSENFNKEIENLKKCQTETIELKNIIIELKNPVEGLNSRVDEVEKIICKLKDRVVEFIQS